MKIDELSLLRSLHPAYALDDGSLERERTLFQSFLAGEQRVDYVSNTKPADLPQLIPHLTYDDVGRAIEWLERAFGFRERKQFRHYCQNGVIGHAELQVGAAPNDPIVMLGMPSAHVESPSRGVSTALYIYVSDIETHYRRALAAGAKVTSELTNQPWGDRQYQVADLEGHQWQFAERLRG